MADSSKNGFECRDVKLSGRFAVKNAVWQMRCGADELIEDAFCLVESLQLLGLPARCFWISNSSARSARTDTKKLTSPFGEAVQESFHRGSVVFPFNHHREATKKYFYILHV